LVSGARNTPAAIIGQLNKEINAGLQTRELERGSPDLAATVFMGSPDDFAKFIAAKPRSGRKVIRAANIKAE